MTALQRRLGPLALALLGAALVWAWLPRPVGETESEPPWDEADTWAFAPPPDDFSVEALLDLRGLNERVAGEHGFVRVDAAGDFVRGDGQPLRFWGVNSDTARRPFVAKPLGPAAPPDLARHARFLAKRGVNLVRLHRQISPDLQRRPDAAITDIDEQERDAIWRAVAAFRREGIYTAISPYWAVPMKFSQAWGIAGGAQQSALGLLFFDAALQRAYQAWMRQLLAEPNPYTGVPLAQDPSVALIELQNEDSLLFWTVDNLRGAQREALEARFAHFAAGRHGSLAAALRAWDGAGDARDALQAGRLGLLPLGELITPAPRAPGRAQRLAEQSEFYARTMHDFNVAMTRYLQQELGVQPLINAGNWRSASALRLGDLERWSYTAAAVDASNRYTNGIHHGPNKGWAIVNGDRYTSVSALREPALLPTNLKHTAGRPMLVTEGGWVMPNAYTAEGPWLVAAYASLTGLDGFCWYVTADEGYTPPGSANGYLPSQRKWLVATPETLGGFPAAALLYRRGDLQRCRAAVLERRPLAELWARRVPAIAEDAAFDPNRDAGDAAPRAATGAVPPGAFLAGPVEVAFGGVASRHAGPFDGRDGRGLIDGPRVRAGTGEIELNAREGWARLDAPRAQGVAAHFARAPLHRLSALTLRSGNAYGAALAVSLDDEPLLRSRAVLLQYTTQSRPSGWRERAAQVVVDGQPARPGQELLSYGQAPWRVVKARLALELRNPGLTRATVLDANGRAVRELPLQPAAGSVRLDFPEDALYVLLR